MRPASTVAWVAIIGAMAFGLFQLKYAVQAREDEFVRLNRDLIASKQAIRVLDAEWSYLNRPERLAELAERHLALQAMTPGQVGSIESLPSRPAPGGERFAAWSGVGVEVSP